MNEIAEQARAVASHCEGKLHGFRKTQEGVVVSFVLHPAQVPSTLALDPLGSRYMIALVPLGDDEQPRDPASIAVPVSHPPQEDPWTPQPPAAGGGKARSAAGRERYADLSPPEQAVAKAALLAKDERFQAWANTKCAGVSDEQSAAAFIRDVIGVVSRRQIRDPYAYQRYLALETRYRMETGLMPEFR